MISGPVASFLQRTLGGPSKAVEIAGDASARRFFRVHPPRSRSAVVLVVHPEPLTPASPLYSNYRILKEAGVPVPAILASDDRTGAVLMEDLGDVTLQKHLLAGAGRKEALRLYAEACDIIVRLQRGAPAALRPDDFAARNALDRDRFLFELDWFHRHYVVGLRRLRPSETDERLLRAFYETLAAQCDLLPRVFCHRDFQSRNLMVRGRSLHVIDYQDARMGPWTYDAASLLRDSSLDIDEPLVRRMLARLGRGLDADPGDLRRDFDLMALQRNIKDLGTFGYMATVRRLPAYLAYVPRTLASVRRTLVAGRRYDVLFPVLNRYILAP